tara:strand:+ start:53 stop:577 length:525 start_codon:yes stop_codon:yes gene_type:complete
MEWENLLKSNSNNSSDILEDIIKMTERQRNRIIDIFKQEINKATSLSSLIRAVEQFGRQPKAAEIFQAGGATIDLNTQLENIAEFKKLSLRQPTQIGAVELWRSGYFDNPQYKVENHIPFNYFTRAFGLREKAMSDTIKNDIVNLVKKYDKMEKDPDADKSYEEFMLAYDKKDQ